MPSHAILIDECIDLAMLGALRAWGHDARRTERAGRSNSPSDDEIIATAAAAGRVILTNDIRSMPRAFHTYLDAGGHHPGMLLGAQTWPQEEYLRRLCHTLDTLRPEQLRDRCTQLLRPDDD